jgi:hypothetical protein
LRIPFLQDFVCTHLTFVFYSGTTNIYINGFLVYENIQFTNFLNFINNYIGSYLNYINSITFNNMAFNSNEILNNYNLYNNNCSYCISSSYQNFLTDYSRKYEFFFLYLKSKIK